MNCEEVLLSVFNEEMVDNLDLNYSYMENKDAEIKYPYFTGEHYEISHSYETGITEGEMLLEGWTNKNELSLIQAKDKIKNHFEDYRCIKDNVSIYINYTSKFSRRTNEKDLKKIEIRLRTQYVKGD